MTTAFSWEAASAVLEESPPIASASLPSPPAVWVTAQDMKIFGAHPPPSHIGLVKCKECGKAVLKSAVQDHSTNCKNIRAKKKDPKSKAALLDADNAKKRKGSPSSDAPPKKKAKTTPITSRRHKGPIDYDKHCGVINDKGLPCSRSLTCKSHSMGAKRSVLGRSRPYDELLMQWHRENNPNWVEPVKKETKAERKEKKDKEKAEKKRLAEEAAAAAGIDLTVTKKSSGHSGGTGGSSKKISKKAAAAAAAAAAVKIAEEMAEEVPENLDDIDSEAELDTMVDSLRLATQKGFVGLPLAVPCDASSWFVQRRERVRCCRDLLLGALGGTSVAASVSSNSIIGTRSSSIGSRLA